MPFSCQCPECGKLLKIPDEKSGAMVKCPECSGKFRAEADELPEAAPMAARQKKSSRKKSVSSGAFPAFLNRWLIATGIVMALVVVLGVIGLSSEPAALAASLICVAAILGCVFGGVVWMVIDLAREDRQTAMMAAFFPPIGVMKSFQQKGPSQRGATVFLTMLIPTVVLGLMLLVFYPKYVGEGRRAAQAGNWQNLMNQLDSKVGPDSPVVSATIKVASNPGSLTGLEPRCEELLRPHKSYVQGSLKIDEAARTISYQYRGDKMFDQMIAFYLGSATGAFTPQGRVEAPAQ